MCGGSFLLLLNVPLHVVVLILIQFVFDRGRASLILNRISEAK